MSRRLTVTAAELRLLLPLVIATGLMLFVAAGRPADPPPWSILALWPALAWTGWHPVRLQRAGRGREVALDAGVFILVALFLGTGLGIVVWSAMVLAFELLRRRAVATALINTCLSTVSAAIAMAVMDAAGGADRAGTHVEIALLAGASYLLSGMAAAELGQSILLNQQLRFGRWLLPSLKAAASAMLLVALAWGCYRMYPDPLICGGLFLIITLFMLALVTDRQDRQVDRHEIQLIMAYAGELERAGDTDAALALVEGAARDIFLDDEIYVTREQLRVRPGSTVVAIPTDEEPDGYFVMPSAAAHGTSDDDTVVLDMFLRVTRDTLARRRLTATFEEMARTDALTGLVSRRVLLDEVEKLERSPARVTGVVMMIDLDEFKLVNDTQGHGAGDALLRAVAERLRSVLPAEAVVARLGGDEFAAVVPTVEDVVAADALCERVLDAIRRPVFVDGLSLTVGGSLGYAFLEPTAEVDALKRADLALYHVKESGKDGFAAFEPRIWRAAQRRRSSENEIESALSEDRVGARFWPILDVDSAKLFGVFAEPNVVAADGAPLTMNERSFDAVGLGLEARLTQRVIDQAFQALATLPAARRPAYLGVSVRGRLFGVPSFVERIAHLLRTAHGLGVHLSLHLVEAPGVTGRRAVAELQDRGLVLAHPDVRLSGRGEAPVDGLGYRAGDAIVVDAELAGSHLADGSRFIEALVTVANRLGCGVVVTGVNGPDHLALARAAGAHAVTGSGVHPAVSGAGLPGAVAHLTPVRASLGPDAAPLPMASVSVLRRRA